MPNFLEDTPEIAQAGQQLSLATADQSAQALLPHSLRFFPECAKNHANVLGQETDTIAVDGSMTPNGIFPR